MYFKTMTECSEYGLQIHRDNEFSDDAEQNLVDPKPFSKLPHELGNNHFFSAAE